MFRLASTIVNMDDRSKKEFSESLEGCLNVLLWMSKMWEWVLWVHAELLTPSPIRMSLKQLYKHQLSRQSSIKQITGLCYVRKYREGIGDKQYWNILRS